MHIINLQSIFTTRKAAQHRGNVKKEVFDYYYNKRIRESNGEGISVYILQITGESTMYLT